MSGRARDEAAIRRARRSMIAAMAEPAIGDQAKRNGSSRHEGNGAGPDAILGPLAAAARAGTGGVARATGGVVGAGTRFAGKLAGAAARRAQEALTADLDDRDPDYIRENSALAALGRAWYRAEVRTWATSPRMACAARRQPHRRQHGPRGRGAPARLFDLLRGRATLLPARPQPGPGLAVRAHPAALRDDGGLAPPRGEGARIRSGGPRLPGRRLGGPPPQLGGQPRRPRRPQGLHPPGAQRRRADRPGGHDRRPGDGALPLSGRLAREAHRRGQAAAAQGAADLDRAALANVRPAGHIPAGEDHDRGPAADQLRRSRPEPTSTRSTSTSRDDARRMGRGRAAPGAG